MFLFVYTFEPMLNDSIVITCWWCGGVLFYGCLRDVLTLIWNPVWTGLILVVSAQTSRPLLLNSVWIALAKWLGHTCMKDPCFWLLSSFRETPIFRTAVHHKLSGFVDVELHDCCCTMWPRSLSVTKYILCHWTYLDVHSIFTGAWRRTFTSQAC